MGLLSAFTIAWILVLKPPLLRPMAWPFLRSARAVLVRAHYCAVDHCVFVIGIRG
jgi:hypothetical protein